MTRRLADLTRATLAASLLAALTGGIPTVLVHAVGWPLPTTIPDLDAITGALTREGIDDHTVLKALAVLVWAAWAQFVAALTVETVALARGRPAPRAPSLPALQQLAGNLLAVTTLFAATALGPRTTTAELHAVPVSAVVTPPARSTFLPPPPAAADPAAPHNPAPAEGRTYTVKRHDSLWSIAEDTLGDGKRWQEIRQLNTGRRMPDGHLITPTTEAIRPGWTLLLPSDATPAGDAVPTRSPNEEPVESVVVERGSSFWSIADDQLTERLGRDPTSRELDAYWRQFVDLNRSKLANPRNPNRLYTGQRLDLPPQPAEPGTPAAQVERPPPPAPAPPETAPSTSTAPPNPPAVEDYESEAPSSKAGTPGTQAPPVPLSPPPPSSPTMAAPAVRPAPDEPTDRTEQADDAASVPTGGAFGAAGLALAAGVTAELLRRRRRRLANLPRGATPPPPPDELDAIRAELLLTADDDAIHHLQATTAALAAHLRTRHPGCRPLLLQASPHRLEALLTEPALPPPDGWTAEASGAVWTTDNPPTAAPDGTPPLPTLVTIGAPEQSGQLYLDLEAARLLSITGTGDDTEGFLRSIALELTHTPLAEHVRVLAVGTIPGLPPDIPTVPGWAEAAEDVLAHAKHSAAIIAANRWPSPFQGRGGRADDNLTPLVVILTDPPTGDGAFDELCALAATGRTTVTVLALGALDGATPIVLNDGVLRIPSLNLECPAQLVSGQGAEQIHELLDDADTPAPELPLDPPHPTRPSRFAAVPQPPEPEILVRFLGEIDVVGGLRPLTPKQTAVFAYIALHQPATLDRIEDAVWTAATSTRRKRLANTISECRTALGANHLPLVSDGQYRTGPGVATDLDLFDHHTAYANTRPDDEALHHLKRAVDLVRGPAFTYRTNDRASYVWTDLENWRTTWELRVIDTCLRLAELATDLGDHDAAITAATTGLTAVPTHTGLTEALMRAHWNRGEPDAATRVYESHVAALEQLDLDDVADTTIDLRDEIRKQARPAS